MAAFAQILTQVGIISAIEQHVQFARARFGTYETLDFVLVLFSYALSGERTIASFYERLAAYCASFHVAFGMDILGASLGA